MPTHAPVVSVVIPCLNEVGSLRELHAQIRAQFTRLQRPAEIIFIDDGSTDGSRELLRELAAEDPACRVIFFRRNCGKAAALQVGFQAARGELVLTLDADLQDDPQEIPRFLEALEQYDVVSGWKAKRHDPLGKTLPSKLFNATVRNVTGVPLHDMNCGFKGYRRAVVKEITLYGELHRFIPALAAARGFTVGELVVTHHPRRSGVSKYGWERLVRGFLDLVTLTYITKFRFRPLHTFGAWALGCFSVALALCAVLSPYYSLALDIPRWVSIFWVFDAVLFIVAPILFGLGVIAEGLLANTFPSLPTPPITEQLNEDVSFPAVTDEVVHAE